MPKNPDVLTPNSNLDCSLTYTAWIEIAVTMYNCDEQIT